MGFLEGTLALFPGLIQLDLTSPPGSTVFSMSAVAAVTSLQCLVLRQVGLKDEDLFAISNYFPLGQSPLSTNFIASSLSGLIHLDLYEHINLSITEAGCSSLSKLTNLRSLDVQP